MRRDWASHIGTEAAGRPFRALLVASLVLAAAVPGLLRLELRTDGSALVPVMDPAIITDLEVRRHFGLRDPLLVILETEHEDGIFNAETVSRLDSLARDLAGLEGVDPEYVVSLATERSPRFHPRTGDFLGMLEPPPVDAGRLEELRSEIEATDVLHGTLVSHDRTAAVVMVGIPNPPSSGSHAGRLGHADRRTLYHRVAAVARPYAGQGHHVTVVGAPAAEALLGEHILHDLALLIPLVLLVVGTALWVACGRLAAASIGLVKVGAAQLFTFGLIGWSGEPVYLTTAMIPVVLVTVGIADEVHLLWSFYRRAAAESIRRASERTLRELARPVVFTSLTTAVGFLTFSSSSIRPVASFGLFTALGVLFSMAWSLTVTPSLWTLLPAAPRASARPAPLSRLTAMGTALAGGWRWTVPGFALAMSLLTVGLPRLIVQDSWVHNFASDSPLRLASERADQMLAGTHILHLAVTFDPPPEQVPAIPAASGPLLAPAALHRLQAFEEALRERPEVGAVLGLASHLSTTAYLWGERHEQSRVFVDDPHWIHLHIRRLANVRGETRRRELVDDAFRSTVVTVLLEGADYLKTAELIDAVRRHERQYLAPGHARVALAGDLAVSQAMIPAIVRTQVGSLLLAFTGCGLIASLLFRSLRIGFLAVAPSAVGLVCTLGVLGWLGIPLGVATSMFCAVTLGIGVDYSLHLLARYRSYRNVATTQAETRPGVQAVRAVAPAILIDAAAVILGFGLLLASSVPTNRWLGLAVAVALATSALFTLGGTGGALLALDRRRGEGPTRHDPRVAETAAREEAA
ncbi:MAG: MMPL family transporter [bacterium]|nr:MMPL family transporter [bacterium]